MSFASLYIFLAMGSDLIHQLDGYDVDRGFRVVFGDDAVDCDLFVLPKQ